MVSNSKKMERTEKFLCVLLLICIVFGNVINSGGFKVAGMVLTLYRVGIPLIALYYLIKRFQKKAVWKYFENRWMLVYVCIMLFWLVYGAVLMFVSQYSSLYDGLKELLDLFLGLLTIYCVTETCVTREKFAYFLKVVKVIVCILCTVGLAEMLFGFHLPTSRYRYTFPISKLFQVMVQGLAVGKLFPITSIFFGINDFAAFISIFFPLFLIHKDMTRKEKIRNIAMMLLGVFILSVGDANISLIAILSALIFMMILKMINRYSVGCLISIVAIQQWIGSWIGQGIIWLKKAFGSLGFIQDYIASAKDVLDLAEEGAIDKFASTTEVLSAQLETAGQGNGSLYIRAMLLIDSLEMWLKSRLLGVGPSGFTNYLEENGGRTKIVNPHNFWFEILSQYGIFVFVAYVGMMLCIFIKNIKNYLANKDFLLLQYLCIMVTYVISSIAPSNFLGYGYQWIVPGLGLAAVKIFAEKENRYE